jgi:SAM-dependent methyltransferase
LDIASGFGRHAIWLYENGWQVTAVDRNAEAIAQLRAACPGIDAKVADLEQDPYPGPNEAYDLIVCWLYYQPNLYPAIREAVRPGGIAVLCARLQGRFAAQPGELRTWFPGWHVLHQVESEGSSELIVRRPGVV